MTSKVDDAIDQAKQASERVSDERRKARESAVRAMRQLEARVLEALDGDKLIGLSKLMPPTARELLGERVNAWSRHGSGGYLPDDGREVLILARDGSLQVAKRHADGKAYVLRPVLDDELVAEDLESYVRVLQEALQQHALLASTRQERLMRIRTLADRLIDAVGLDFRLPEPEGKGG